MALNYKHVRFSDDFYKLDEVMIKFNKDKYLNNLEKFNEFYNKYRPDGFRVINGRDVYNESKEVLNQILKGRICIDHVFTNPDNPLRNIVMLMQFDEPYLKKKKDN